MTLMMLKRLYKQSWAARVVPTIATSVVLLALWGDRAYFKSEPPEAETYHASVRGVAEQMPKTFGSWVGQEMEVPAAAVKMLHPNVIISRRYQNIFTGQSVGVLLVHVKDARDLLGHYPPVCYPGQGWRQHSATSMQWAASGNSIEGTEYQFDRDNLGSGLRVVVDNFFVMRGAVVCRNMDDVELAAQDRQRKFFGAAQVQFVHDGNVPADRRRQCEAELMKVMEPTLAAISAEGRA